MPGNDGRHRLQTSQMPLAERLRYEKALADTLRGFLTELCLTNAGVVIAYISGRQDANIDDLIASSAEMFLKPGQLSYGREAVIESDWGMPPYVSIAMWFRHDDLNVRFNIVFDEKAVGVHLECIDYASALGSDAENLRRFESALAAARISAH